jgi:predicted permease
VSDLPEEARRLVDELVARSGLSEAARRELRADLEEHFRDGLARGRPLAELVERFGDPAQVAPLISSAAPPPLRPTGGSSGDRWAAELLRDLALAARTLVRAPSVVSTSTVVLALGIGVTTVVFTVLNELLLRPLPVDEPSGLVDVWPEIPGGNSFLGISYADFGTYRDESRTLADAAAFSGRRLTVGPPEGGVEVIGQLVSPSYFAMLGVSASVGSLSFAREARFGEPPSVVLAHAYWTDAFAADPDVLGRTLQVDGVTATIIGVGPAGFAGHFIGFPVDLWLPITAAVPIIDGFDPDDRAQKPFEMIARLHDGVPVEAAQRELDAIAERIEAEHPVINRGHRVGVTPTTGLDHSLQAGVTAFVTILTTVSLLVLLIACLNVGSMLLVRAMSRDREISIRVALGAGSVRLVRQLLVESTLLVGLGAAAGVATAVRLNALIADGLASLAAGIGLELGLDWRVLGLACVAAGVAVLTASVAPALHVMRKDPASALRARGGPSGSGGRLRAVLVVGQIAVSVVLVVATGLFVRALVAGGRADPGFEAERIASFTLRADPRATSEAPGSVEERVMDALRGLPGVAAVTVADASPVGVARSPVAIEVPGVLPPPGEDGHVVDARVVGAGYLETVGIALRAGRDLQASDDREGPRVAVVSAAFVRAFRTGGEAVGWSFQVEGEPVRVVGVAADARYIVQDPEPDPLVYLSRSGRVLSSPVVTLRADAPGALTQRVRQLVASELSAQPPVELRTARDVLSDALLPQRVASVLVGAMGLAALLLASVGLYGLVHFTVARDRHEMGVRLALGGGRRDLMLQVLRKGFRLAGIGTLLGLAVALVAAPALETFLAGVSPADPLTYGAVLACFGVVALAASVMPARRALRIEATEALRGS